VGDGKGPNLSISHSQHEKRARTNDLRSAYTSCGRPGSFEKIIFLSKMGEGRGRRSWGPRDRSHGFLVVGLLNK